MEKMKRIFQEEYDKYLEWITNRTEEDDNRWSYYRFCQGAIELAWRLGIIDADESVGLQEKVSDAYYMILNEEEDTLPFPEVMKQENKPWELMDAEERADEFFNFPEEAKRPEEPEEPDQQDSLDELREFVIKLIIRKLEDGGYYAMSKPWDKEILQRVHAELPECYMVVGQKTLYFVDGECLEYLQDELVEMMDNAIDEISDCQHALRNLELHEKKYSKMLYETGQRFEIYKGELVRGNREAYEAFMLKLDAEDEEEEEETCEAPETGKAGV